MIRFAIRRGFTLVELLVVVIVLAALVALLMPALNKARHSAIWRKCGPIGIMDRAGKWRRTICMRRRASWPLRRMPVPHVLARVSSFDATIALTPRLSVGT